MCVCVCVCGGGGVSVECEHVGAVCGSKVKFTRVLYMSVLMIISLPLLAVPSSGSTDDTLVVFMPWVVPLLFMSVMILLSVFIYYSFLRRRKHGNV